MPDIFGRETFEQFETPREDPDDLRSKFEIIQGKMAFHGGAFQSPNFAESFTGWTLNEDGSAEFQNINLRGTDVGVEEDGDIQGAIDLVSNNGGGTVRLAAGTYNLSSDIEIKSNVQLIGAGRDQTILEFGGNAAGMTMKGTSSTILNNTAIIGLTVQNSNNAAGIDIDYADFWRMENVRVTSCDQKGVLIDRAQQFQVSQCLFDNNSGDGLNISGSSGRQLDRFVVLGCTADTNAGDGFSISGSTLDSWQFVGCYSRDNTSDGFFLGNLSHRASLVSCDAESNDSKGFNVDGDAVTLLGCRANQNSSDGFDMAGEDCALIGCHASSNGGQDFDFGSSTGKGNTLVGCYTATATSSDVDSELAVVDKRVFSVGNLGASPATDQKIWRILNNSGGSRSAGEVVVIDAESSGRAMTTTTTAGDDKVFGVVSETIANGAYGSIIGSGKTALLKVDGTTDIAIGDFLATFTSAGIAAKAAAGDMAFAIALEAYTTDDSNGVIDALLIKPRKI